MLTPGFVVNVDKWIEKLKFQGFQDDEKIKNLFSELLRKWEQSERWKLVKLYEYITAMMPKLDPKDYPKMTIQRVEKDLPVAHTCFYKLDMIEYVTIEALEKDLNIVLQNFQSGGFDYS